MARLALLAALVAGLVACGTPNPPADGRTAAPADAAPLDFTAPAVMGGQVDGGDLAGRDLVLWFWAPW